MGLTWRSFVVRKTPKNGTLYIPSSSALSLFDVVLVEAEEESDEKAPESAITYIIASLSCLICSVMDGPTNSCADRIQAIGIGSIYTGAQLFACSLPANSPSSSVCRIYRRRILISDLWMMPST